MSSGYRAGKALFGDGRDLSENAGKNPGKCPKIKDRHVSSEYLARRGEEWAAREAGAGADPPTVGSGLSLNVTSSCGTARITRNATTTARSFDRFWHDLGISRLLPGLALKTIMRDDLRAAHTGNRPLLDPPAAL